MSGVVDWRNLPAVSNPERPGLSENWQPSQTFLKIHDVCDRAAMLYLNFKAGAGSHELNRGSIYHEVVARLTRHAIREGEPRIGDPNIGKEFLLEYMDENPHLQVKAAERDALRFMIAHFCVGEFWDPEKVEVIENSFTLEIGGFKIIGRVDRADVRQPGELEIVDYKTQMNLPDAEEFKPQSFDGNGNPRFAGNFQTMLYALGLAYGVMDDGMPLGQYERYRLRLAFPAYLRPDGLGKREVVVTQLQLLDFKADVESQLRRLREVNLGEGKWQPTPGNQCRECPASYACPLPRLLRPESQHADLEDLADLEKAATASWFMSKRASNLKARVKKTAERLEGENPGILDLGDGRRGVRIGTDLAFLFLPTEKDEIRDKAALNKAISATATYGEPFDWSKHFRHSEGTSFEKRKIPSRRRDETN